EIYHRYILGVYAIMERITAAFPDVLFESCSGGGGRFDAGILYYMPQNWTSDDSDAIQRLNIQYGCSMVYPASAMTCHVSAVPNHQVHRVTPLHTRGNVAMAGSFGYELDMSKMTDEEKAEVALQVEEYKRIRDLVVTGNQYRLISPVGSNECAFMVVAEDKSAAIVTYVKKLNDPNPPVTRLRLKGLDENARYRDDQGNVYAASTLMHAGLNMPEMQQDFDSVRITLERV
ncbi:MAG: alpha-galactosidase, partial [Candidatus Spyradocola sp.]